MWASPVLSVALWALALAATIWILVPAIAFAFGVGGVQTAVVPDVGPDALPGSDPDLERRLSQLTAHGFRRAGRTRESGRFVSPTHWRWEQFGSSLWLVSPDGRTYVVLHRMVADEPVRISAVTAFDGGGLVRTSSPGAEAKASTSPNYWRLGMRNVAAETLIAKHQEQVEAFARERGVEPVASTIAEVAAADEAASRRLVRKTAASSYGLVLAFLPAVFVVPLLARGRTPSSLVALGICTMAGFYALMRWAVHGPLLRYAARRSHTHDLSGEPDDIAPDGRILASGKNERALRTLAMTAALLMSAWPIAFASQLPKQVAVGPGAVLFQLVFLAAGIFVVTQLAGRALGRMVLRKKGSRNPAELWTMVMLFNVIFLPRGEWNESTLQVVIHVVAVVSVVVGFAGWRLEKSRGK